MSIGMDGKSKAVDFVHMHIFKTSNSTIISNSLRNTLFSRTDHVDLNVLAQVHRPPTWVVCEVTK